MFKINNRNPLRNEAESIIFYILIYSYLFYYYIIYNLISFKYILIYSIIYVLEQVDRVRLSCTIYDV